MRYRLEQRTKYWWRGHCFRGRTTLIEKEKIREKRIRRRRKRKRNTCEGGEIKQNEPPKEEKKFPINNTSAHIFSTWTAYLTAITEHIRV